MTVGYYDYYDSLRRYDDEKMMYDEINPLLKVIKRVKYPQKPDMDEIGARYALQYKDLDISVLREEYLDYFAFTGPGERKPHNPDRTLDINQELGEMWTIVEYIGDGLYMDTITGEIFTYGIRESDIADNYDYLMEHPLGIGIHFMPGERSHRPSLSEITPDIEEKVLETIQFADIIRKLFSMYREVSVEIIQSICKGKSKVR